MRAYYFFMKFLRSFMIGFFTTLVVLTLAAAAGLIIYSSVMM